LVHGGSFRKQRAFSVVLQVSAVLSNMHTPGSRQQMGGENGPQTQVLAASWTDLLTDRNGFPYIPIWGVFGYTIDCAHKPYAYTVVMD